jgi:1,4-alpha-glucan branching enzyme
MKTRTWLSILVCCAALIFTQRSARADEHEFKYKGADAKSVDLMCDFNGWKAVPMTKGDDGIWTVKVDLPSGAHAYKFLIDGKDWVFDPDNSAKKTVDGVENSSVEIK